jgi:hypothetical protein
MAHKIDINMKTNKNNRGPFAFVWLIGIPNTAQVKTLPLQCQKQNYGYTLQVGCPIRRFSNQRHNPIASIRFPRSCI